MNRMNTHRAVREEGMRIGGKKIFADDVIEVRYPYTNEVIGTVPAGRPGHVRDAFAIAAQYRPKLSRYERQRILFRAAELIAQRKEALSDVITLELGISKKDSLYECGRAFETRRSLRELGVERVLLLEADQLVEGVERQQAVARRAAVPVAP